MLRCFLSVGWSHALPVTYCCSLSYALQFHLKYLLPWNKKKNPCILIRTLFNVFSLFPKNKIKALALFNSSIWTFPNNIKSLGKGVNDEDEFHHTYTISLCHLSCLCVCDIITSINQTQIFKGAICKYWSPVNFIFQTNRGRRITRVSANYC